MKHYLLLILCGAFMNQACEKSESTYRPLTSYTVANATTDQASIKVYAADHEISWKTLPNSDAVGANRSINFGAYAGANIIRAVSAADTVKQIFFSSKEEAFNANTFNTIFLAGDSVSGYEGVFLNNEAMTNHSDSVIGIRFINLSSTSGAVNITLATSPATHKTTGLAYKQFTEFKTYPSTASTLDMIFEVRNLSDSLLGTYKLPTTANYPSASTANARFKNLTLVIKGVYGNVGANPVGMFPVVHY